MVWAVAVEWILAVGDAVVMVADVAVEADVV